jgi:hypothetical protein
MTKSPLRLAKTALATARQTLPPYSSKFSRKDFTQHQLFALLVLRQFLKQDYRGLEQLLHEWSDLRQTLGLAKVPDHSTLQKAAQRLLEKRGRCPAQPDRPPSPTRRPDRLEASRRHRCHRLREPPLQPLLRLAAGQASPPLVLAETHRGAEDR